MSTLLLGACARSAIDTEEELEGDSSPSTADAGEPEEDAAPSQGEDAGTQPELDAATPARDASTPQDAAADASAMDASQAEAGRPDSGPADAGMDAARDAAPDAAPDAARDAAPVDAAPPRDTAPPPPPCTAGNYRGNFTGDVDVVIFDIPLANVALTGTISLTAVAQAGTDRFTVTNGKITGQDTEGNQIMATVTGNLNCTTGKLENGKMEGTYAGGLFLPVTFTGNVQGTYTNTPPSANGTWATETSSTPLLQGGSGTWNVALVQ